MIFLVGLRFRVWVLGLGFREVFAVPAQDGLFLQDWGGGLEYLQSLDPKSFWLSSRMMTGQFA